MGVEMKPDYKKRRTIAVITSVVALVILAFYTRCSEPKEAFAMEIATQMSDPPPRVLGKKDAPSKPPAPPETAKPAPPRQEEVEHLLLLGIDRAKGGRTDAIMVVALNHTTGHIGVISIPRDLYLEIPRLKPGRINTVFRLGNRELGPGKGLELLKRIIKREFGIEIRHTILADFHGFVTVVDKLGGIDVEVKCPIQDCFKAPVAGADCIPLSLTAGTHRLDGRTALLFARSRHGRSDSDRSRRQQAVLVGLKNLLKRQGTLGKLPTLWFDLSRFIGTDLDLSATLRIARLVSGASRDKIHGLVLRHPIVEQRRTRDGKEVVELNRPLLKRALGRLFTAPVPGTRKRSVCPAADIGLHWRERLEKRKGKPPAPLVSTAQ